MKKYLLAYALAGVCLYAPGQSNIRPLTIGDTVPDITFTNLINYPSKTAQLSDFRSKLVILDFWATTCTGCVAALPRLDSLQNKYKDQLQILLITYEDEARVTRFFKTNPIGKKINLSTVMLDAVLKEQFPHKYLSHEVWIGADKKVLAITEGEYVNDENIHAVLAGSSVNWPVKQDIDPVEKDVPLLHFADEEHAFYKAPRNASYTTFSTWLNTREPGYEFSKDSLKNTQRFYITNYPIIGMYLLAYGKTDLSPGYIKLDVPDKDHYVYTKGVDYMDRWDMANRYCYETVMPLTLSESMLRKKILNDLDSYFNLKTSWATELTMCLVLQDTLAPSKRKHFSVDNANSGAISLSGLLYQLGHKDYGTPVLNESTANMETVISAYGNETIPTLNAALLKHGLVLSLKPRRVTMLTIQTAR
ncbi:TlpA disulfide reductase family protein [Niabella sp.]|uniref:TlpA family protein disulfide reductase n=1 Tax=Niabella sp. TaxID=1962976 RepID=UPI00261D7B88|nr:TlpA disulfide reductase family protein [Niabella sp.]